VTLGQATRTAEELQALSRKYVLHHSAVQGTRKATLFTTGQGCYTQDASGKRYLDFSAQLTNCNLGYQHPKVVEAIVQQARRLCYIAPQQDNELDGPLGEMIAELTPGDLDKSYFTLGGSEAIEVAVMIARLYTGRYKIISRYKGYHGASYGAASVGGTPARMPVGPGLVGTVHTLWQDCFRCPFGQTYPGCHIECVEHIDQVIQLEGPDQIAAVIVEPIVSGLDMRAPEYFPRLRQICDKYGILLIADEIVTGFGRSGRWFGSDHYGVVPDMMTLAKGMNSGYAAVGAVTVNKKIADYFDDHQLGVLFTSGALPLGLATCIAVLEVVKSEGLVDNARRNGEILEVELPKIMQRHRSVGNTYGKGMLWMIDMVRNRETKAPMSSAIRPNAMAPDDPIGQIREHLMSLGLSAHFNGNNLRVSPPLIMTGAELREGLAIIDEGLLFADELAD
jgi:taurine--2-oxoglutarate transaminase